MLRPAFGRHTLDGLKWSTAFEIGVAEIDTQHRHLFALAEAVGTGLAKRDIGLAAAKVREFIEAAQRHFASEERILARAGFPEIEAHKVYHASLLAKAKELDAMCDIEANVHQADACYREVLAFLVDDVVRGDSQFKSYLQHHGLGGAPPPS
jgi:hemerythrin